MKISVVVVTYNRKSLLSKALELYDRQSCIQNLIVVDNASSDGTDVFLSEWSSVPAHYKKTVLKQKKNLGGSFGFYTGLKYAANLSAEWIWVSDDDVFINDATLPTLLDFISSSSDANKISAVCSAVWQCGHINYWHRCTIQERELGLVSRTPSAEDDYHRPFFEINAYSFVGILLNKSILLKTGFPLKNYFIWFDDTEHSLRMAQNGHIFVIPASTVLHGPFNDQKTPDIAEWKKYYDLRNYGDLIRRHFSKKSYHCFLKNKIMRPFLDSFRNKQYAEAKVLFSVWMDLFLHRLGRRRAFSPAASPRPRK